MKTEKIISTGIWIMKTLMVLVLFVSCSTNSGNDETQTGADTEAPTKPSGLYVENVTQTTAELYWDAATDNVGVQYYSIYQNGTYLADSGQTFYALDDLEPGTAYTYQVLAIDAAGNASDLSDALEVRTIGTVEAELQYASGNIDTYLQSLIDDVPGSGGNNYTVPTTAQLEQWEGVINGLLEGNVQEAVAKAVGLNYQITEFTDTALPSNRFSMCSRSTKVHRPITGVFTCSARHRTRKIWY